MNENKEDPRWPPENRDFNKIRGDSFHGMFSHNACMVYENYCWLSVFENADSDFAIVRFFKIERICQLFKYERKRYRFTKEVTMSGTFHIYQKHLHIVYYFPIANIQYS